MAKTTKPTETSFDSYELSILEDAIALYVAKTQDEIAGCTDVNDPDLHGGEEMIARAKDLRRRLLGLKANDEEYAR